MAMSDARQREFTLAFRTHWQRFVGRARASLGSTDDAEDAVSSAFTRALERHATYDPDRAPLPTWLAVIVRNEVTDRLRARARLHTADITAAERLAATDDVAAMAEDEEQRAWLRGALQRLPERDRRLLALRFGQGLTNRAIARLLDADEHTVSVWILRAMRRLKAMRESEEHTE